jgi:hypothetical protein
MYARPIQSFSLTFIAGDAGISVEINNYHFWHAHPEVQQLLERLIQVLEIPPRKEKPAAE